MGLGSDKLSDLIAEIWDRSHHIFKKVGAQKILRWLIHTDELYIDEIDAFSTDEPPYPATWAPDTGYDNTEHIYWNLGVWAPGGAGAITVDAAIDNYPGGSVTADANIILGISANANILKVKSPSVTADASITFSGSRSITSDADIFAPSSGSITADASILASQQGSVTADSSIETSKSGSITADSVAQTGESSSIAADAVVETSKSSSITADADIDSP